MFIVRSRLWGAIAGVATAFIFVFVLGAEGQSPPVRSHDSSTIEQSH